MLVDTTNDLYASEAEAALVGVVDKMLIEPTHRAPDRTATFLERSRHLAVVKVQCYTFAT
jgi:hypothetical protein